MKKENQAIQPEGRLSVLKAARKRQDAHKSGLASDDPDPCKVEGDTQIPAVPFPTQLLKIVEWSSLQKPSADNAGWAHFQTGLVPIYYRNVGITSRSML